jgi:hypothetical protein
LERGDYYGWRDVLPRAPKTVRVALLAEPRTVAIAHDRVWWVPRLDQLIERMEAALNRRSAGPSVAVRERFAGLLTERLRDRDASWEEVVLELLLEHEAAGR